MNTSARTTPEIDAEAERLVGVSVEDLTALYLLDSLRGFGPQKFKELWQANLRASDVVGDSSASPEYGQALGRVPPRAVRRCVELARQDRLACRAPSAREVMPSLLTTLLVMLRPGTRPYHMPTYFDERLASRN